MRSGMTGWTRILAACVVACAAWAASAVAPVRRGPLIGGSQCRVSAGTRGTAAGARPKTVAAKPRRPPAQTGKPAPKGAGPRAPYRGAIAVDAETGRVLFADNENTQGYPASVTKLMTFLLVLEDLQNGKYALTDRAAASAYAASMEPSKVDIRPGQTMSIEDLLYAIMVKSANDAAVVLAEHAAWVRSGRKGPIPDDGKSRERVDAFVARMNRRAQELGMVATRYESPNGLPPGVKERRGFDTSTALDLSRLGRRVVSIPGALKYTSAVTHSATNGEGEKLWLSTHNYFLPGSRDKDGLARPVPGCDGLKTGYTAASGSSIALTAARNGRRVVVIVLGSAGRHEREAAAGRILRDALDALSFW